jgi:hypothetical protein
VVSSDEISASNRELLIPNLDLLLDQILKKVDAYFAQTSKNKLLYFSGKKGFVATIFNPFCTGCCAGLDQETIYIYLYIPHYTTMFIRVAVSLMIGSKHLLG